MRFLFDENLSHRLVRLLSDLYPGSVRVRDVGSAGASDDVLWVMRRVANGRRARVVNGRDVLQRGAAWRRP